tara:strand:+ start:106655 stop:107158 length:504 start_codon:yes stop_codon:yes gene_type:complete
MKTAQFWEIIEASIQQKNSIDKNEQGDALLAILSKLNHTQILGFHTKLEELKKSLNSPEFNNVAFMMKYGDNRMASSGFKNWVVALGREHYEKATSSPTHLLTLEDSKLFAGGRAYLNDLDLVASVAYDEVSKEGDPEWYTFVQNHRRLQQLNKSQGNEMELDELEP